MVICHRTRTPVSSPTEIPFSFTLDLTGAQCVPELLQGCGEVGSEGGGEGRSEKEHLMGKVQRRPQGLHAPHAGRGGIEPP